MTCNRAQLLQRRADDSVLIQAGDKKDKEKIGRVAMQFVLRSVLFGPSLEVHTQGVCKASDDGGGRGQHKKGRHRPRTFCQPIRAKIVRTYNTNTAPDKARRKAAKLPKEVMKDWPRLGIRVRRGRRSGSPSVACGGRCRRDRYCRGTDGKRSSQRSRGRTVERRLRPAHRI